MPMSNPPHPGEVVKYECMEPLGLSLAQAATGLGVPGQSLDDLINERIGVSAEMAIRLSKAFGSTPETWLGMQMDYDLWHIRKSSAQIEVSKFKAPVG